MPKATEDFLSRLHREYLKPRGYKKSRHTFSRDCGAFTERFQLQGSAWNEASGPWRFYVNVGVEFHGVPPRKPARGFPGTHCWTRIENLVPGAPVEYDLPLADQDAFAAAVSGYVKAASERLASGIGGVRSAYDESPTPQLSLANQHIVSRPARTV
jgi:hypothetical protein